MSIQEYLHEKAAESRQNKLIIYMIFLDWFSVFRRGYLLINGCGQRTNWFLFIPYLADFTEAMFLEIGFLIVGLFLLVGGIGAGVHYYRNRGGHMKELGRASNAENLTREQRMQIARPIAAPKTRTVSKRTKTSK